MLAEHVDRNQVEWKVAKFDLGFHKVSGIGGSLSNENHGLPT